MPKRATDNAQLAEATERRDGFLFRGDRLALDFTATMTGRKKQAPRDLLAEPGDLDRWLVAAALPLDGDSATAADVSVARALREAIYRVVLAHTAARTSAAADRGLVNEWAARPCPAPQLPSAPGRAARWLRTDVEACLAAVALDAVMLLTGPEAMRLRECDRDECAMLFVDTSRSGERRWCSMRACGNKIKVSRFRERARSDT